MASRKNTLQDLRQRLASWEAVTGPEWLAEGAPKIIAELRAEIAERESAIPSRWRELTKDTVIDKKNDRIEGDVGL